MLICSDRLCSGYRVCRMLCAAWREEVEEVLGAETDTDADKDADNDVGARCCSAYIP